MKVFGNFKIYIQPKLCQFGSHFFHFIFLTDDDDERMICSEPSSPDRFLSSCLSSANGNDNDTSVFLGCDDAALDALFGNDNSNLMSSSCDPTFGAESNDSTSAFESGGGPSLSSAAASSSSQHHHPLLVLHHRNTGPVTDFGMIEEHHNLHPHSSSNSTSNSHRSRESNLNQMNHHFMPDLHGGLHQHSHHHHNHHQNASLHESFMDQSADSVNLDGASAVAAVTAATTATDDDDDILFSLDTFDIFSDFVDHLVQNDEDQHDGQPRMDESANAAAVSGNDLHGESAMHSSAGEDVKSPVGSGPHTNHQANDSAGNCPNERLLLQLENNHNESAGGSSKQPHSGNSKPRHSYSNVCTPQAEAHWTSSTGVHLEQSSASLATSTTTSSFCTSSTRARKSSASACHSQLVNYSGHRTALTLTSSEGNLAAIAAAAVSTATATTANGSAKIDNGNGKVEEAEQEGSLLGSVGVQSVTVTIDKNGNVQMVKSETAQQQQQQQQGTCTKCVSRTVSEHKLVKEKESMCLQGKRTADCVHSNDFKLSLPLPVNLCVPVGGERGISLDRQWKKQQKNVG